MVNTQADGGKAIDRDRAISKIVLEHILVLAVAQEAGRDETKPKVVNAVTLEVSPEQAEKIDLARSVGTLSLVLRNQVDPTPSKTSGATKDSLLAMRIEPPAALPPTPAVAKPAAPRRAKAPAPATRDCVEVIRGTAKSFECF